MSTDSEIIRRSLEDPGAFGELFERHARMVGAFAARRVGTDAADDVVSDTMLVAFRKRRDFDHAWESAKPWLLGIASRIVRKHRAREAAHWRSLAASDAPGEHADDVFDAAAARVDAAAAVRSLAPRIAAMPARDRDVLLLYAWGELTYEQIAAALAVPVGTVRSRLNRVRRTLAPPGSHTATRLTWMAKEEIDGRYGTSA